MNSLIGIESPIRLELSKKQIKEILKLEDDRVKEGEGKVLDIKMGIGKEGKCIIFKEKKKIVLIMISPQMEAKSIEFPIH